MKPTSGLVWYHPSATDRVQKSDGEPLAAIVTHEHEDGNVNLCVFAHSGDIHPIENVPLRDADDREHGEGGYAIWPDKDAPSRREEAEFRKEVEAEEAERAKAAEDEKAEALDE